MTQLITFRTLEPLHIGAGRGIGHIDLPIAREAATGWPVAPGSGVKGALRDAFGNKMGESDEQFRSIFGAAGSDESDSGKAGALCPPDAFIFLMPVASLYGGFAWVTCPLALRRLRDLASLAGITTPRESALQSRDSATVKNGSSLKDPLGKVQLLDLRMKASEQPMGDLSKALAPLAGLADTELLEQLAIVDNAVFRHLTHAGCQISTKVTLEKGRKVAKQGGLRTEESVPVDAAFAGVLRFQRLKGSDSPEALSQSFQANLPAIMQFGGKSSTGHGLCQIWLHGGKP